MLRTRALGLGIRASGFGFLIGFEVLGLRRKIQDLRLCVQGLERRLQG